MTHTVSGHISLEIYLQAQQLHRGKTVKKVYLCCALLTLLGAAVLVYGERWGLYVLAAGIGAYAGQWMAERFYVPYKMRQIYAQYRDLEGTFSMTWDMQSLSGQGPHGQFQRPWRHYYQWLEDPHVFLLYIAENLYEVVPKARFPSAALVDDFRQGATQIGPVKP